MERVEAIQLLEERGIPFQEDRFLHYVEIGDFDVVQLFLAAGVRPGAVTNDGRPAVVAAAQAGHHEIASALLASGADGSDLVDALHRSNRRTRDIWDKLSSASGVFTLVSSVAIAAVGWSFTSSYNDRQIKLAESQAVRDADFKDQGIRLTEMETVVKMIPHLAADEMQKQAALLTLHELARPGLATRMAELFGGEGSIGALQRIAESDRGQSSAAVSALVGLAERGDRTDATAALESLGAIFRGKERSVVQVLSAGKELCSGFVLAEGWVATAAYCFSNDTGKYQVRAWDGSIREVGKVISANPSELRFEEMVGPRAVVLLELSGPPNLPTLPLATARSQSGDRVIAIGYGAKDLAVEVGRAAASARGAFDVVQFPGSRVKQGAGGGPMLNERGEVVCMIFRGSEEGEECVPADAIATALAELPR